MSLLDIASLSGLISRMNGKILNEEFDGFISSLQKFENNFEYERKNSVESILKNEIRDLHAEAQESILSHGNREYPQNILPTGNIKNQLKSQGDSSRKGSRKAAILDFIKDNSNSSIKDIVPNIIGCSEKTIQRELIDLINEGKIRKIGERRWSRYSLI